MMRAQRPQAKAADRGLELMFGLLARFSAGIEEARGAGQAAAIEKLGDVGTGGFELLLA